ncbi:MAG: type IV pilus assembly protein PilM [Candidatus Zambryskibacteria bacterium]|nr:type IV pilus assembly protein PilM [Candidatus Zambryskibacteria bacterium]
MTSFLSNLFGKETLSVIGIDIGSSSIKVVQLKKKGAQAILETYGELSLGPYAGVSVGQATSLPEEKITQALSDLLKEKEVNVTTRLAGIAIPYSSSLMTVVEMPVVPPKELATMIPIEARKYIPVPISEVSLDWSVIPRDTFKLDPLPEDASVQAAAPTVAPTGKMQTQDVLLVAIHNETLSRFGNIAAKNQLITSFFEIEIFSTMRAVLDQTTAPMMIFDMGAATTKLFIVERGILRVSHTINRGSQNITSAISKSFGIEVDKAEVMKRHFGLTDTTPDGVNVSKIIILTLDFLFIEANRIILAYEKKYNKNVSKVLLVGGGSSLKGIEALAQKNFQTEVYGGDPFSKVVTPAFLDEILKQTGPQFAVALGLALRRLEEQA